MSRGGHVAAALNHLPDQLVVGESQRDTIQGWAPISAGTAERMAVTALLYLKYQRALTLQCGCAMHEPVRHRITAPRIHVRAPRRKLSHARKGPECDGNQQHGENRDRPPLPAFFSFAGKKGQEDQCDDRHRWDDEKKWRLHRRRKQRQQSVKPQEKVIRLRGGLDNRRIRLSGRSKRTEVEGTGGDGQNDEPREEQILPNCIRNEGRTFALRKRVIVAFIGGALNNTPRHRPFVDPELQHHEYVKSY